MKKFIAFMAILALSISCGKSGDKGELVGIKGGNWHPEKPYGMTLVPGGAFIMGKSDDDVASIQDAPTKTVTVRSFYMDETEITNSEYRQFVEWVKDSTMRVRLAILADETGQKAGDGKANGKGKNAGSIGDFAFNDQDPEKMTAYDKYMYDNYYSIGTDDDPYAGRKLNHKVKLIKDTKSYPDEYYTEVMDSMYLPLEASYNGLRTIDVDKLKFRYSWMDIQAAAKAKVGKRKDFIRTEQVKVYPDTTTWIKDFSYSYNEPLTRLYFSHAAYNDYPVVGVTWKQAVAFAHWRTNNSDYYAGKPGRADQKVDGIYRLPTEAEWEYAARGNSKSNAMYPWGSPYTRTKEGRLLANFKPGRGDYFGGDAKNDNIYTTKVKSYTENDFRLFDMAGNVAEWTSSVFYEGSYNFFGDFSPDVQYNAKDTDPILMKRKVIRGGSWKDIAYNCQVSSRNYEYQDTAKSYIGFRCVLSMAPRVN